MPGAASRSAAIMALVAPGPSAMIEAGRYVPVCLGCPSCLPHIPAGPRPSSQHHLALPVLCPPHGDMDPSLAEG